MEGRLVLLSRTGAAQRHLDVAAQGGQWRTQLMARVGGEALLNLEGAIQAVQHGVQHGGQPPEFVDVRMGGYPFRKGTGLDRLGLICDLPRWPQCHTGDAPPDQVRAGRTDRGEHRDECTE